MDLLYTAHVPAGDGPFPTLLVLHGWGASAHDLIGLAPILHGGDALVISPQGPLEIPVAPGMNGYGWFPLSEGRPPSLSEFTEAADRLRAFVDDVIERYPVDRRKLVVVGFSQGGVMGYDLVLRDPARYAGLVALSSWLPAELFDAIPKQEEHEHFPTFVCHGTADPMIPVDLARESRERLTQRGVDLTYREYEEMQHEVRPEALRDLVQWLEGKVLSPIQLV